MRSVILVFALLALAGCSLFGINESSDADQVVVVELDEGESTALPPFNATLQFVAKTLDTRCPVDVICASAGEATILLRFARPDQAGTAFSMTWPWAPNQGLDAAGHIYKDTLAFRFTWLDLLPYPDTRVSDPKPAIAQLRIERRP